jgi:hypothetical protein
MFKSNNARASTYLPFFVLPGRIFFAMGPDGATGFGSPEPEFDTGMAGGMVVGGSETAVVETARVAIGVVLLFMSAALHKTTIRHVNPVVKKHTGDS